MDEQEKMKQAKRLLLGYMRWVKENGKIQKFRTIEVKREEGKIKFVVRVWNNSGKEDLEIEAVEEKARDMRTLEETEWVALIPHPKFPVF